MLLQVDAGHVLYFGVGDLLALHGVNDCYECQGVNILPNLHIFLLHFLRSSLLVVDLTDLLHSILLLLLRQLLLIDKLVLLLNKSEHSLPLIFHH